MYFLPICPQLFAADGVTAGPGRGSALALSRETDWLVLDLFFFLTFFGLSTVNMKVMLKFKRKLGYQAHQTFPNAGYYISQGFSFKNRPEEPTVPLCLTWPGPVSQACGLWKRTMVALLYACLMNSKFLIIFEQEAPTFSFGTGFCELSSQFRKLYSQSCMSGT